MAVVLETAKARRPVVLTVDDELGVREAIRQVLQDDCNILEATDSPSALAQLQSHDVDLVLLDVRLPGETGIDILERIKGLEDSLEVIMVTAVNDVRTAVVAMQRGAYDYVVKPFDVDEMQALVRRALEKRALQQEVLYLRSELASAQGFDEIVGRHPAMVRIYERIAQLAETTATVLITGESGTGKELIARALHRQGPRRERAFVAVNLAAIPEPLLESELFGHEKGAFTGAYQKKPGKFEVAHGGTLFLDEVGTLRVDLQAKLLRVLQDGEITRVGGAGVIKVDVRVLSATNQDLDGLLAGGRFREDLYYRINTVSIRVPPLRDRAGDIPALAAHFAAAASRRNHWKPRTLSPDAVALLRQQPWKGNVRELRNVVERVLILSDADPIGADDVRQALPGGAGAGASTAAAASDGPLADLVDQYEREVIRQRVKQMGGHVTNAARSLGLERSHLYKKCRQLGIDIREEA